MKRKTKQNIVYLKLQTGEEIVAAVRYSGLHCFILESPLKVIYHVSHDTGSLKLTPWIPTLESLHDDFLVDIAKRDIITASEAPPQLAQYYSESRKGYLVTTDEILKKNNEEANTGQTFHEKNSPLCG